MRRSAGLEAEIGGAAAQCAGGGGHAGGGAGGDEGQGGMSDGMEEHPAEVSGCACPRPRPILAPASMPLPWRWTSIWRSRPRRRRSSRLRPRGGTRALFADSRTISSSEIYKGLLRSNGRPVIPLAMRMANGIPLGMGCGSSAAGTAGGHCPGGAFWPAWLELRAHS